MKTAIKIVLAVCAVIVLGIGALAALAYYSFLYTTPLSEAEVAELEVDWSPATGGNWSPWVVGADGTPEWNPAKSFNDWLETVPEEDKAWVVLADLKYKYPRFLDHGDLGKMPVHEVQWARLVPMLETAQADEVYQRVKEAFERPVMGCGLYNTTGPIEHAAMVKYGEGQASDWDPNQVDEVDLFLALLPTLSEQRGLVNFQMAYASHKLEGGDAALFVEAAKSTMQGADLVVEFPGLINYLVKIAIQNVIVEYVDWALSQHGEMFSDTQLAELDAVLGMVDGHVGWMGEAMSFRDTVRRMANEDGSFDLLMARYEMLSMEYESYGPATSLPTAQLHTSSQRLMYTYEGVLKRHYARGMNPLDDTLESGSVFYKEQKEKLGQIELMVIGIMLPSLENAFSRGQDALLYSNAVRLGIAAYRHKIRHGVFPETIEAMDKEFLDFVPMDVHTGGMLMYRVTDLGPTVYPDESDLIGKDNSIYFPRQYEPIIEDDEPEVYDWEYPDKTPEEIEEMNQP